MTTETAGDAGPELVFAHGVPGFPDARRFVLTPLTEDDAPVFVLQGLDEGAPEFAVVPPAPFFPDYSPELGDADVDLLGLESADDALLLLVLTVGDELRDTTANLLAPVVVNQRTRAAAQVILTDTSYDVATRLFSA